MARGINKVILLGHLGKDPDVKYMPNGNAVANFNLATSEAWKDKQSRKWTDQKGIERYTTEIVVDFNGTIQFLDKNPNSNNQQSMPNYQ